MEHNYRSRALVFAIVAGIHLIAIFCIVFSVEVAANTPMEAADVMKLVDINEQEPPPPPEMPVQQTVTESIAENILETETLPDIIATAPASVPSDVTEVYLPQSKISKMPQFDEKEIRSKLVYPAIAQRSGIEQGRALLELFVNRQGQVTRVDLVREEPPDRGFGEAAVRAFTGTKAAPAEANGQAVAARIRYPVRFLLR